MYVDKRNVERIEGDSGAEGVHICNLINMIKIGSKYEQKRRSWSK